MSKKLTHTTEFLKVVARLRKECPWDKKQTHKTLIPYLVEEAYETVDAIESRKMDSLKEELGDLLLQVVLHAEIAKEKGHFTFDDVAQAISKKMVDRHPHVFGDQKGITTAEEQTKNWSRIKEKERPKKSLLSGLPRSLPSLQLAQRYGEIAASVNFDWPSVKEALAKVDEELKEVKVEIGRKKRVQADVEMEIGDLLFALTRVASHCGVDSERALRKSSEKFRNRFEKMEKHFQKSKRKLSEQTLKEMEKIWRSVKNS
jgi:tetrapyrrole methylase family protein/MazG family protein